MILLNIRATPQQRVDPTPIRVLYAGDIELARPQFASSARQLTLTPITDVIGAFGGRGAAANVDVAVIDCGAPGINAAQIVSQLRALRLPIPIVLVLDPGAENGAATALSLEGDDYTVKTPGWLSRLPVRLQIVASRYRRLYELEATAAREQRIRTAVERAPVCLGRVFDDGSVGAMNDAALKMLAVDSLADVLKKPLAEFVVPSQQPALKEFITVVCGGEARSVELSIVPKQGDQRIMELRGVALPPDTDGRLSAIVALRDLSERRRLEASVLEVSAADSVADREAEARFAAEIAALRQHLADGEQRFAAAENRVADAEQRATSAEQRAASAEQRVAAAENERQQLAHDRDAQQQAAAAASAEAARLNALLAERPQPVQDNGDLERAYHDARAQAEAARAQADQARAQADDAARALEHERQQAAAAAQEAARALEYERQQAATAAQEAAQALDEQRQLREAIEQRLDLEEQRRFAEVVERNAESERAAQLAKECDALRASLDHQPRHVDALEQERRAREMAESRASELQQRASELQQRATEEAGAAETLRARCAALDAERNTYLGRIQELERRQHEQSDANNLLEQERRVREAAESRLAQLDRRIKEEIGAAEALRARNSALDEERQRLLAAAEQAANREAAERQAREAQAAASAAAQPSYEEMVREQAAAIESLTAQLRDAETARQRASSERDDRDQACRALEAELRQSVESRRAHRQELLTALTEAQQFEELAARHLARCTELERRLTVAKAEFDELTAWAVARAARAAEALK